MAAEMSEEEKIAILRKNELETEKQSSKTAQGRRIIPVLRKLEMDLEDSRLLYIVKEIFLKNCIDYCFLLLQKDDAVCSGKSYGYAGNPEFGKR